MSLYHMAIFNDAGITHKHRGTDTYHRLMTVYYMPYHAIERHRLYDTIHIGTYEIFVRTYINAGIRTITLSSTMFLVNYHQLAELFFCRFQNSFDRLRWYLHRNIVWYLCK